MTVDLSRGTSSFERYVCQWKCSEEIFSVEMAVCQNLVPLVNIKIAGKWMFIPLKMVLIGIDPYPNMLKYWEWQSGKELLRTHL